MANRRRMARSLGASGCIAVAMLAAAASPAAATVTVSCSPSTVNVGQSTTCTASADGGPVASSRFSFPDGSPAAADGLSASTTYASAGSKGVSASVTYVTGVREEGSTTVTVVQPNRPPTVQVQCTPTCSPLSGQVVTFALVASDPDGDQVGPPVWNFGDGAQFYSDSPPARTYPTPGTRRVSVTVSDGKAAPVTRSITVRVQNRPPTASYTYAPPAFATGQTVTFTSNSTDPDNTIVRHLWDLDGNGTYETDTGATPRVSRSFPSVRAYTIGLQVVDSSGGRSVPFTQQFTPGNRQPVAAFGHTPAAARVGENVVFTSSSIDYDGSIAGYAWDLNGDGAFAEGSTATVSRTFLRAGTYTVSLRVGDDKGAAATVTRTISVGDATGVGGAVAAGAAAPALRLMRPFPVVRLRGDLTRRGARIRLLAVQAAVGARAVVRCRGRSCARRSQSLTVRGRRSLRFTRYHRHLRAGTILEVAVTRPGTIGKHVRFVIRKQRAPLRKDSCMAPGARSASRCPAP